MLTTNIDEIENYLKGISYPANKGELISQAQTSGAENEIVALLNLLPDKSYSGQEEVNRVLNETIQKQRETGIR